MKILYVPFPREQAGDLDKMVQLWQENHLKNFSMPIKIIFFGDDFDLEPDIRDAEIYICAHGGVPSFLYLGNNSEEPKGELIDIDTLANRYNHDFLYYAPRISKVHLYCCGGIDENYTMANRLNTLLLGSKKPIIFYSGSLSIADEQGNQWSFGKSKPVLASKKAKMIYCPEAALSDEVPRRKWVKELPSYEGYLEQRCNYFFMKAKHRRAEIINQLHKTQGIQP